MLQRNVFIAGVILVLGSFAVTASAQGPGGGMFGAADPAPCCCEFRKFKRN